MQVREQESRPSVAPTEPGSEPLTLLAADAGQKASDEDDSHDAIFLRAVSEIPTQPLPTYRSREQEIVERYFTFSVFLVVFCLLVSSIAAIVNQPVVTVTLFPVHKSLQFTTTIPMQTRTLAAVTLTRTLAASTTGKGHQDARPATGTLTLYNGQFSAQTVATGTVLIGRDGQKVATTASVTIPAANPPQVGEATVSARVLNAGSQGNIAAGDITIAVSSDLLVKNLVAFTGGQGARDFQAVAQHDLDALTLKLQQTLTQAMPQAFSVLPGEAVTPTNCVFTESADHGAGDEAKAVTVHASKTCAAIAYNQDALQQKATAVFNATRPGKQYERVGSVQTSVLSLSPLTVHVSGSWSYVFSQGDEQLLAQQITGETPAQAKAYLLKTGLVSRVTITQTQSLPDPYHIKFLILIGG